MGRTNTFRLLALVSAAAWGIGSAAMAQDVPADAAPSDTADAEVAPEGDDTPAASSGDAEQEEAISREFLRELRTAEARAHALKERVFRSKATLQLLRELVVQGSSSGAALRITHDDKLGRAYQIESIQYFLDGKSIYAWADPDGQSTPPDDVIIRDQAISPGEHALQVSLVVRGDGGGFFEYLDDYRFKLESNYAFEVPGGELTDLTVRAMAKGGVKKRFVERPTVVYEERREQMQSE